MCTKKSFFRSMFVLVCSVVVLGLAAACNEDAVKTERDHDEQRSAEKCDRGSSELVSRMNTSEEEYQKQLYVTFQVGSVRRSHNDLLWRQPNVYDVMTGFLRDGKGGWTDTWGISVWVTEKVEQSTLPPEDRIPGYLEGVPVQIIDEEPLPSAAENMCDYDTCGANISESEGTMATANENRENTPERRAERRHEVRLKYDPLFWRQPNVHGVGEGAFTDENGERTETHGIIVHVTRKVDQSALPPEDRIPDCLDGIPVQIVEEELWGEFLSESLEGVDKEEVDGSN